MPLSRFHPPTQHPTPPRAPAACRSRGPHGEPQKSHWQTVVALLSARPVLIEPGATLRLRAAVQSGNAINAPTRYELEAELSAGPPS